MPHPKDSLPQSVNEILPAILDTGALMTMTIDELEAEARAHKLPIPKRDKYTESQRREFLLAALTSWIPEPTPAQQRGREIREKVAASVGLGEQLWLPCAPVPPDLCRLSPFFVMAKAEMKERPFIKSMVFSKGGFGELTYTGPRLSTYEEDVFIAILSLINEAANRDAAEPGRERFITYKGNKSKILTRAGFKSGKGGSGYKFLQSALEYLHAAVVIIKTRDGKKDIANLLTHTQISKDTFKITLNEYFYETFISGGNFLALIDVDKRNQLTPTGKALYRFVSAQSDHVQEKYCFKGHFITLAEIMNLNPELPLRKKRATVKEAIAALVKNNILTKESRLFSNDQVVLYKHPETAKRRIRKIDIENSKLS